MKIVNIQFEAGESRHSTDSVNFLISTDEDKTFYAECIVPIGSSDDYGYLALKAEIIRQADEIGIPAEHIAFPYDGQEQYLAEDAAADVDVMGW